MGVGEMRGVQVQEECTPVLKGQTEEACAIETHICLQRCNGRPHTIVTPGGRWVEVGWGSCDTNKLIQLHIYNIIAYITLINQLYFCW